MANKNNSSGASVMNATNISIGVAGLAAAALGAYWLYGSKKAPKHRKEVSSLMFKAWADVMDAVSALKNVDKMAYLEIVDEVIKKYSQSHADGAADVATISKEMKAAWPHIMAATKPVKKITKKILKK